MLRGGRESIHEWNRLRASGTPVPDLREANLRGVALRQADLRQTNLWVADLQGADLSGADLRDADLTHAFVLDAQLVEADLRETRFGGADLRKSNLRNCDARKADFRGADLRECDFANADLKDALLGGSQLGRTVFKGASLCGANLEGAILVETNLEDTNLTGCSIYGIAAWCLALDGADQSNLIISPPGEPTITVDNLEVAQFIYLLLNNKRIRQVIDTITSKVVLILGRFSESRKPVLDAIRAELRCRSYCPVLFDFETPATRDTHETITTLARLARFVIADLTDPRSVPQELVAVVETVPSVPVQPLLQSGHVLWGMYDHIRRYPWVLGVYEYESQGALLAGFAENVIVPAEARAIELRRRKS